MVVSGLAMLGFGDFLGARYSSYPEMLDVLRTWSTSGAGLARRVFERIVFDIVKFSVCVNAAHVYGLSRAEASDIIERQVTTCPSAGCSFA
jgi:hypothetical protein